MQGHLSFIHNQYLLLGIGVIAVLASILFGFQMFGENSVENNRDAVILDLNSIADKAQTYYRTKKEMGGGNRSYINFKIPLKMEENGNGSYKLLYVKDQKILVEAIGKEKAEAAFRCTETNQWVTYQLLIRPNGTTLKKIR